MLEEISWYFPLSALLNAVTSTVLGFYIIFTNFKKRVVRYLFLFCLAVASWSYSYFMWQIATDAVSALFWSRILMIGAIFTSIFYLHLVLVYLILDKEKFYRTTLIIFYLFSFTWIVADATPYFVATVVPRSIFKFWPIAGDFYFPFLISFATHFIYASVLLFKKYRQSLGVERMQALLLGIGMLIGFIGGSTNYALWYNINILPWGNGLVVLYVILTVYAIMKYKLLDLRVVSAEIFTGLFFLILLFDVFLSNTTPEFIFRILALVAMTVFGMMLIRSVRHEVRRKDELAEMAKSLEIANAKLQELDKQKTEFLSIASHQLRTPLTVLKGYVELIEDGAYGKISRPLRKILGNLDSNNEHLIKLVDDYLDISRIEQGRTKFVFKPADLNKVVASVVEELREKAAKKGLKIVKQPNQFLKSFSFDEDKVRHVILNFVDNAVKYSDQGKIVVAIAKEDGGVALRVKDQGIGFGKIDEANFYQKFFRGDNVKTIDVGGTGLGLYVCRKFMEAHRGRVWAKSPGLGRGSEFGFWMPLNQPQEAGE